MKLLISFFYSISILANCDVDFSQTTMAHMQPMDQGSSDLCYAYVTAQMLDAYRSSRGDQRRISPSLLAVENTLYFRNSEEKASVLERNLRNPQFGAGDTGLINETYSTFLNRGACPLSVEQAFSSDKMSHPLNELLLNFELQELVNIDEAAFQTYCRELANTYVETVNEFDANLIRRIIRDLYIAREVGTNHCDNRIMPLENMPQLHEVSHVPTYIDRSVNRLRNQNENFLAENLASLDEGLCQANQPVAITYCSQMASDPNFRSFNEYGQDFQGVENPPIPNITSKEMNGQHTQGAAPHLCGEGSNHPEGKHVSLIIGRRVVDGRVQYKMRNTYGNYRENQFDSNSAETTDHWIDAQRIGLNVSQMSYLRVNE